MQYAENRSRSHQMLVASACALFLGSAMGQGIDAPNAAQMLKQAAMPSQPSTATAPTASTVTATVARKAETPAPAQAPRGAAQANPAAVDGGKPMPNTPAGAVGPAVSASKPTAVQTVMPAPVKSDQTASGYPVKTVGELLSIESAMAIVKARERYTELSKPAGSPTGPTVSGALKEPKVAALPSLGGIGTVQGAKPAADTYDVSSIIGYGTRTVATLRISDQVARQVMVGDRVGDRVVTKIERGCVYLVASNAGSARVESSNKSTSPKKSRKADTKGLADAKTPGERVACYSAAPPIEIASGVGVVGGMGPAPTPIGAPLAIQAPTYGQPFPAYPAR